ncbi:hypothetical protein [Zavarzinia sp.]|uniref:hypothetical protein n=1 Tax=Zavarzinia sp. TaxID=2027920 RepID=UPI0035633429
MRVELTGELHLFQTVAGAYCWAWRDGARSWIVGYADVAWRPLTTTTVTGARRAAALIRANYGGPAVELPAVGTTGAAAILGLSPETLRVQIYRGKLRATDAAHSHQIAVAEVARYGRENRRQINNVISTDALGGTEKTLSRGIPPLGGTRSE